MRSPRAAAARGDAAAGHEASPPSPSSSTASASPERTAGASDEELRALVTRPLGDRARDKQQRERERKRRSRLEQKTKLHRMSEQVDVLEAVAAAVATLGAEDAAWDDFLDDGAKRMRAFLRKSLRLSAEREQLVRDGATLRGLLREHELWVASARALLTDQEAAGANDWAWNLTRWRALSLAYFTPWTLEQCLVEVDAAVREMNAFVWSRDTTSSGMNIMGWYDQRRLDRATASIQFCFHKTFRASDLRHHMQHHWDVYTDTDNYRRIVLGGNALASVEVIQRVTPSMWIVRYDERYAGEYLNVHVLYLLFRVEIERGFLLCLRSIACPDVQSVTDTETDCWTSDSVWLRWELLDGKKIDDVDLSCTDYLQSVGGSLMGDDLSYASRWLFETLAAVIRAEVAATNKPYLQF